MAESAAQVYARLGAKDFTGKLDLSFLSKFGLAIKVEDVVEFRGAEGCAKSEILLNIAAKYLTSKKWHGTSLTEQHNDVQVVFVSTDLKFDISRLTTIVENQITMNYARSMYPSKFPDINSVVLSAMSQMQVFYCNSTTDLLHMLLSLHTSLCNNPQVCILMVDNVANFYWSDKNEGYGFSWRFEEKQPSWTTALQELIEEHQIVVFATRPLLFKEMGEKMSRSFDEHFVGKNWQKMVKYRFLLQRVVSKQNTFCAKLTYPVGSSFVFTVKDCGLEFQ